MRWSRLAALAVVAVLGMAWRFGPWSGGAELPVVAGALRPAPAHPVQTVDDDTAPPPRADVAALLAAANPLGDMTYGSSDAPVTVVEYASLTCIHCHRFHTETFAGLKVRYVDTGLVRWIVREYATDGLATDAMMLARCAGKTPEGSLAAFEGIMRLQPMFLDPMHPEANGPTSLIKAVGPSLEVGRSNLDACLEDRHVYEAVNATYKAGRDHFGVAETPTFFVDGEPLLGNRPILEFQEAIERHVGRDRLEALKAAKEERRRAEDPLKGWNAAVLR